jgi:cytochrome c oxidase assembly factor 1
MAAARLVDSTTSPPARKYQSRPPPTHAHDQDPWPLYSEVTSVRFKMSSAAAGRLSRSSRPLSSRISRLSKHRRLPPRGPPHPRAYATLPPPNTPSGSVVIRPAPNLAVDVPKLIPPPAPGSGPLMERRADRELPKYVPWWMVWVKTLPLFAALLTVSALGIFNYQKLSSSTVASILYALRTNPQVREVLGGEIYFRDRVPWITGTMNQLKGVIDIGFGVKGKRGKGYVRFRSFRQGRRGFFETKEWSLELEDGRVLQLLESEGTDRVAATLISPATNQEGDTRLAESVDSLAAK